jgi:membrane fusion protein (multidrug efflux system)
VSGFEARLAQAKANPAVAVAQHDAAAINSQVVETSSGAGVALAEAGLQTTKRQVESQVGEAQARLASAKAAPQQVAYSRAQTQQAAAQIAQMQAAELDLSYTKIDAPVSGHITRKSVEPGAYVQVGQTLFSIVPDRFWVVANFK